MRRDSSQRGRRRRLNLQDLAFANKRKPSPHKSSPERTILKRAVHHLAHLRQSYLLALPRDG
jgi:hypothetical protein